MPNNLTATQFIKLIDDAYLLDSPRKLIYCNYETRKYTIYPSSKSDLPVSLREIVMIAESLGDELKSARGFSQTLTKMSESKEAKWQKISFFKRLICKIIECFCNLFRGLGFRTTASAAIKLAGRLGTLPKEVRKQEGKHKNRPGPRPRAQTIDIKQPEKMPQGLEPVLEFQAMRHALTQVDHEDLTPILYEEKAIQDNPGFTYTGTKLDSIRKFVAGETLGRVANRNIFGEVKVVSQDKNPHYDRACSLEGLIQAATGKEQIDFTLPAARIVFAEVVKGCTKEFLYNTLEWLIEKNLFTPRLLKLCLNILHEKWGPNGAIREDLLSIETLLGVYQKERYNCYIDKNNVKHLPSDDESIVNAVLALIKGAPNQDTVSKLITKLIKCPEYSATMFSRFLQIFRQKEEENRKSLVFPLRNLLVADFQSRKDWVLDENTEAYLKKIRHLA